MVAAKQCDEVTFCNRAISGTVHILFAMYCLRTGPQFALWLCPCRFWHVTYTKQRP